MSKIHRGMPVADLAAILSQALTRAGITAVLSGGTVVSIYSANEYRSADLDFVTFASIESLTPIMESLGFERKAGRHFVNPECDYAIEFPPGPPMLGNDQVRSWASHRADVGTIQMLTPTQCVMDRLAAFYHWNDRQCLDQAVMVGRRQEIDLRAIEKWSQREGHPDKFVEFKRALRRKAR